MRITKAHDPMDTETAEQEILPLLNDLLEEAPDATQALIESKTALATESIEDLPVGVRAFRTDEGHERAALGLLSVLNGLVDHGRVEAHHKDNGAIKEFVLQETSPERETSADILQLAIQMMIRAPILKSGVVFTELAESGVPVEASVDTAGYVPEVTIKSRHPNPIRKIYNNICADVDKLQDHPDLHLNGSKTSFSQNVEPMYLMGREPKFEPRDARITIGFEAVRDLCQEGFESDEEGIRADFLQALHLKATDDRNFEFVLADTGTKVRFEWVTETISLSEPVWLEVDGDRLKSEEFDQLQASVKEEVGEAGFDSANGQVFRIAKKEVEGLVGS